MRVAVVYFSRETQGKLVSLARAYVEGVSKQGHDVALINGFQNASSLFIYDYLILGAEPLSALSSKIDPSVQHSLKNMGHIDGKFSYAFMLKRGLWGSRSLLLWMKWLESCGLLLLLSDLVAKTSEARLIGQNMNIYKGKL